MTIIDGIGDEVTYFFITVIVVVIATIAWITTDIQQNLYVRTVYLLEHSRHETRVTHLTNHTESATISEGIVLDHHSETEVEETEVEDSPELEEEEEEDERSGVDPVIEEIIATMEAPSDGSPIEDASILRQRRLQRFQNPNPVSASNTTENTDNIQNVQTSHMTDVPVSHPEVSTTDGGSTPITIKLKFIDDNMKIVDAQLEELLGDFKRRHFDVELAANKLVRLIFNGQVLKHDQQTLASYGMFDNCVVHCLVHQPRVPAHGEAAAGVDAGGLGAAVGGNGGHRGNSNATHRDWDLGNLLIATLSFTLGSAWYFRFQYPQLFTIWTTIGLIGLTSGFGVIALVRYFPEVIIRDQVIVVS